MPYTPRLKSFLKPFSGLLVTGLLASSAPAQDVILQYFESSWQTMERRMPDVFMAGYGYIWVPPPSKADSGGFSVGYDVFDRFNLGSPFDRTLYGTEKSFSRLSDEMDTAGVGLYIDTVLNHNGFRDSSSGDFEDFGGYPGFVTRLGNDPDGDFHGAFEGGDLNGRLAGLIDIDQSKNYQFVRHPVPGFNNLIPNETPRESNRQFYPDRDLPQEFGRYPFNLADPLAGDPIEENAVGLTVRWLQWMVEVHGVDGFRLDATKHTPTFYYNDFFDPAVFNVGRNPIDGSTFTPFSFGEAFTGDFAVLSAYTRKDGYGNRDSLDFPLYFAMQGVFGGGGFGDMRSIENASFDASDGNPNDGSRGVIFAGSHDKGVIGGNASNLPHAHVLTRAGFPNIYYNAKEFGNGRDFPRDGRGDALGNFNSNTILRMLEINTEYARGSHFTRWIDGDVYLYERNQNLIVGLNDRGDAGYDERTIQTGFPAGTVLVELTGNAMSATIDPSDDIFDSVTVDGSGRVTIRVPRNSTGANYHNGGYVMYGPEAPRATLTVTNADAVIAPDTPTASNEPTRRLTELQLVTGDTIDLELQVSPAGPAEKVAFVKLNYGLDIDGSVGVNPTGNFAGFENFTSSSNTSTGGSGTHTISIDATGLEDGYNYIETRALLDRNIGQDIYDTDRVVVYLDRQPPEVALDFPTQTGAQDITASAYEAVISSDRTVNSVHLMVDLAPGLTDQEILDLVSGANMARQHDRAEWRIVLDGLDNGTSEFTVVAFEETGTYSITRFGNIGIERSLPDMLIGLDNNADPGISDFVNLPGSITSAALPQEIVVRVDTSNIPGGPVSFNNGDYSLSLQVDNEEPIEAVAYDAMLLPPVGILVQNDQNLGDEFDEFRFVWRGYTTGDHTFRAFASLTGTATPPNEAIASTNVSTFTAGPTIDIVQPALPGVTIDNPSEIVTEARLVGVSAAELRVIMDTDDGAINLGTITNPPASTNLIISRPVGSYAVSDVISADAIQTADGEYPIRFIASTAPNGGGIVTQLTSRITITGQVVPDNIEPLTIDGDASDFLALPLLTASGADGGLGGADPSDFAYDGTLTELHVGVRDNAIGVAIRGEFFGELEDNFDNASYLYVDVAAGSGNGVTDIANELTDISDGLRANISSARFTLDPSIASNGIDLIVGITEPEIAYGYSLGTDGLPGSFGDMAYQSGILVEYDADTGGGAGGDNTTFAARNTVEILIPASAIGNANPNALRFVATTANDDGFPSPNTLPENSENEFLQTQIIQALASIPVTPNILINEVFIGDQDAIELYNGTGASVDLSGWALIMNDSADVRVDYVFPEATTINAGEYLVIRDPGLNKGTESSIVTPFNIPWDQSRAASVALIDQYGVGKDYVNWENESGDEGNILGQVPLGTAYSGVLTAPDSNGIGHSLARDASSTDTNTSSDWDNTSGADASLPTLGAINQSVAFEGKDQWIFF